METQTLITDITTKEVSRCWPLMIDRNSPDAPSMHIPGLNGEHQPLPEHVTDIENVDCYPNPCRKGHTIGITKAAAEKIGGNVFEKYDEMHNRFHSQRRELKQTRDNLRVMKIRKDAFAAAHQEAEKELKHTRQQINSMTFWQRVAFLLAGAVTWEESWDGGCEVSCSFDNTP